jgi:TonB family protein
MNVPRREIRYKPFLVAIGLALVIHLQLLLTDVLPAMYRYWSSLFPRPELDRVTAVTLISLSPQEFRRNLQVQPRDELEQKQAAAPEPEAAEEEEPEQRPVRGQVVDVAPTPDSTPPEDPEFLSEHNTKVERESVSRDQRPDYGVAQPRPTIASDQRRRPEQRQEQTGMDRVALVTRKQGERRPASDAPTQAFEFPDLQQREALNLKLDLSMGQLPSYSASDHMVGNSDRLHIQPGQPADRAEELAGEQGEHKSTVAMFKQPSLDQLDLVTGAPSNDHIEDVPKGEATLLNSREFKYATFFNRVKRGVSQHWSPRVGEEYRRRDPYGNIYGVKDRYTLLNVALDPAGELIDVSVVNSSGIGFFDEVAVQSFRDASPFPNPPVGLVESDGRIHFQFGFFFMIGERPIIRAFQFDRQPF